MIASFPNRRMMRCAPSLPLMQFQDFKELCLERRSVRSFSDTPITPEILSELLEVATLSPSVENTQPWHFTVVLDPVLKTILAEASCYGDMVGDAAAFIVVSCDTSARPNNVAILWNPRELEYSCAGAIQTLLLGATAMGIASCWVSLHRGPVHELLALPMREVIIGGIMLGHFRQDAAPLPLRERKSLSQILTFLPPLPHDCDVPHPVSGRGGG